MNVFSNSANTVMTEKEKRRAEINAVFNERIWLLEKERFACLQELDDEYDTEVQDNENICPPPAKMIKYSSLRSIFDNLLSISGDSSLFYAVARILNPRQTLKSRLMERANVLRQQAFVHPKEGARLPLTFIDRVQRTSSLRDYRIVVFDLNRQIIYVGPSASKVCFLICDVENVTFVALENPRFIFPELKRFCFTCFKPKTEVLRSLVQQCLPTCPFCLRSGSDYPCERTSSVVCAKCHAVCPNSACLDVHLTVCPRPNI